MAHRQTVLASVRLLVQPQLQGPTRVKPAARLNRRQRELQHALRHGPRTAPLPVLRLRRKQETQLVPPHARLNLRLRGRKLEPSRGLQHVPLRGQNHDPQRNRRQRPNHGLPLALHLTRQRLKREPAARPAPHPAAPAARPAPRPAAPAARPAARPAAPAARPAARPAAKPEAKPETKPKDDKPHGM